MTRLLFFAYFYFIFLVLFYHFSFFSLFHFSSFPHQKLQKNTRNIRVNILFAGSTNLYNPVQLALRPVQTPSSNSNFLNSQFQLFIPNHLLAISFDRVLFYVLDASKFTPDIHQGSTSIFTSKYHEQRIGS